MTKRATGRHREDSRQDRLFACIMLSTKTSFNALIKDNLIDLIT